MKHAILLLLSVLAAATVAAPKQPTRVDADRLLALAKHRVAKGDKIVASANKIRKESKRAPARSPRRARPSTSPRSRGCRRPGA